MANVLAFDSKLNPRLKMNARINVDATPMKKSMTFDLRFLFTTERIGAKV